MHCNEKQTEQWMQPQTRKIVDGNGHAIELEQTTLFWELFDELISDHGFTESKLIQLGRDTVAEHSLPFDLGIQDAVAHLYKAWSGRQQY